MSFIDERKKAYMILKKHNPKLTNKSGIYFIIRFDRGFKFCYIGQAKHILDRLVSHYLGYESHIDKSLKKHKLVSNNNPTGWQINCLEFPESSLDAMEQHYILKYANAGYQMYNILSGGQDNTKFGLKENENHKGYYTGVKNGFEKARKYVAKLFDKQLTFHMVKHGKLGEKAEEKFKLFLKGE